MQSTAQVTEYKIGAATVRMHGMPDRAKLEAAAQQFLKDIERNRMQKHQKEAIK